MFRSCTLALLLSLGVVAGCSDAPDIIPPKPAGAGAGSGGKSGAGGAAAGGKSGSGSAGKGDTERDAGSEEDASL